MKPEQYLEELVLRYPALNSVMDRLTEAYVVMEKCFRQGGKLLVAGNGGSASAVSYTHLRLPTMATV